MRKIRTNIEVPEGDFCRSTDVISGRTLFDLSACKFLSDDVPMGVVGCHLITKYTCNLFDRTVRQIGEIGLPKCPECKSSFI